MPSRLFVASIGNPGNLYNTLHSSGHLMADALQVALGNPAFLTKPTKQVSAGATYTLYKSNRYMNESGEAVAAAFRAWKRDLPTEERTSARLLVLHDELELGIGRVGFKSPATSFRGHNGLKSVAKCLGYRDFARVAIGIGRPDSRDPDTVSDYVLAPIRQEAREKITGRVGDVVDMLNTYAEGG